MGLSLGFHMGKHKSGSPGCLSPGENLGISLAGMGGSVRVIPTTLSGPTGKDFGVGFGTLPGMPGLHLSASYRTPFPSHKAWQNSPFFHLSSQKAEEAGWMWQCNGRSLPPAQISWTFVGKAAVFGGE